MHYDSALLKAIRRFGSQEALAKALGLTRNRINYWLNHVKQIPFEYAIAIEELTNGEINRYHLAPYAKWLQHLKAHPIFNDKKLNEITAEENLMSKIRTIKPELFRHENLFEAEQKSQLPLRLVFMGLFTCCDREGRFRWRPRQLKLDILPYDELDFENLLNNLHQYGFIERYEKDNEHYGYIPTWTKHQSINTREPESKLPDPSLCVHVQDTASPMHAHLEMEVEMELEKEMEVEKEEYFVVPARPREEDPIAFVFAHWKKILDHPQAKLDEKRKALIRKALKAGYSVKQLCEAIDGCACTPHNLGDNDRGQRYDGLHVILRDADQIDRFIRNFHNPPKPLNTREKKLKENVQVAQRWLNKKMQDEETHE